MGRSKAVVVVLQRQEPSPVPATVVVAISGGQAVSLPRKMVPRRTPTAASFKTTATPSMVSVRSALSGVDRQLLLPVRIRSATSRFLPTPTTLKMAVSPVHLPKLLQRAEPTKSTDRKSTR